MKKVVRYAAAVVGAVPALGLMAITPADAAPAHAAPQGSARTGKTVAHFAGHGHIGDRAAVRMASTETTPPPWLKCKDTGRYYENSNSGMSETFWATNEGTGTCIGRVIVNSISALLPIESVGTKVTNKNGRFCAHTHGGTLYAFNTCGDTFVRTDLAVWGSGISYGPATALVADYYPFTG